MICMGKCRLRHSLTVVVAACQWQLYSNVAVFRHGTSAATGISDRSEETNNEACRSYADLREILSFCILNRRVDRFISRSAAAPCGPATTQLLWVSALRICCRSVSARMS